MGFTPLQTNDTSRGFTPLVESSPQPLNALPAKKGFTPLADVAPLTQAGATLPGESDPVNNNTNLIPTVDNSPVAPTPAFNSLFVPPAQPEPVAPVERTDLLSRFFPSSAPVIPAANLLEQDGLSDQDISRLTGQPIRRNDTQLISDLSSGVSGVAAEELALLPEMIERGKFGDTSALLETLSAILPAEELEKINDAVLVNDLVNSDAQKLIPEGATKSFADGLVKGITLNSLDSGISDEEIARQEVTGNSEVARLLEASNKAIDIESDKRADEHPIAHFGGEAVGSILPFVQGVNLLRAARLSRGLPGVVNTPAGIVAEGAKVGGPLAFAFEPEGADELSITEELAARSIQGGVGLVLGGVLDFAGAKAAQALTPFMSKFFGKLKDKEVNADLEAEAKEKGFNSADEYVAANTDISFDDSGRVIIRAKKEVANELPGENKSSADQNSMPDTEANPPVQQEKSRLIRQAESNPWELSYDDIDLAIEEGIAINLRLEIESIRSEYGATASSDFIGMSFLQRNKWWDKNATISMEEHATMANAVDTDRLRDFRDAIASFDGTDARSLGRSIAVPAQRALDKKDQVTPDMVTVRKALEFARDNDWSIDEVRKGMEERAIEFAGNDARELFNRVLNFGSTPKNTSKHSRSELLPKDQLLDDNSTVTSDMLSEGDSKFTPKQIDNSQIPDVENNAASGIFDAKEFLAGNKKNDIPTKSSATNDDVGSGVFSQDNAASMQANSNTSEPVPRAAPSGNSQTQKVEQIETGSFKSGIDKVESAADVAHLTASIRKNAQEGMFAVVTDDTGNILRVLNMTKGDSATTPAPVGTLSAAIRNVPGAKRAWAVHNHPDGDAVQSPQDVKIAEFMREVLDGSGVESQGMVVVAPGGRFTHRRHNGIDETIEPQAIKPAVRDKDIPVSERKFTRSTPPESNSTFADPAAVRAAFDEFGGDKEGILLLNSQRQPVGFVAMRRDEMKSLRNGEGGASSRLLKAFDESNAFGIDARINVDDTVELEQVARNLKGFENKTGFAFGDVISKNGASADQLNLIDRSNETSTFYSRNGTVPTRLPSSGGDAVVRPDEIISDLARSLDVPIRLGRLTHAAKGIFKTKSEVIRRHNFNDMETISHEVGHLLETRYPELTKLASKYKAELLDIASEPNKGGSHLSEGMAEHMRLFLSQRDQAKKLAPGYTKELQKFLGEHKAEKEILEKAAKQIDAWFKMPPADRVRSKMGEGEIPFGQRIEGLGGKFITETLDAFHPIKIATRNLAPEEGLLASENPYLLARLTKGSGGIIDHFFKKGTLHFDFNKRAEGPRSKPLADVLAPVANRVNDFEVYMTVRRAEETSSQGREKLFTDEEISGTLSALESKKFRQAFDELQTFQLHTIEWAKDGGMISQKSFDKILEANKNYVPFSRIIKPKGGAVSSLGNQKDVVNQLHGSSLNIKSPLQSIIENTSTIITATNRNHVARTMAELAEKTQGGGKWMERLPLKTKAVNVSTEAIAERFKKAGVELDDDVRDLLGDMQTFFNAAPDADARSNQIIVRMNDGERVAFELEPSLYEAMTQLSPKEMNLITKAFAIPAKTVRMGVTLSPEFMLRNLTRDTVSAWMQSKSGFKPGLDTARGALKALTKNDDYWAFQAFGGAQSSMWSGNSQRATNKLHQIVKSRGWDKTKIDSLLDTPDKVARALETIGDATEVGTRIGEFTRVADKGGRTGDALLGAAFSGREVSTDFAMRGRNPAVFFLTRITPFLNAGAQGIYKGARTLTEEGFKKSFMPTALKLTAGLIVPSIALHLYNRDQQWYQDLEPWERDLFWHFKLPGNDAIARIPKPFEWGLFGGTIPEYLVDAHMDENVGENAGNIGHAAYEMFALRALPPAALIPAEEWANKVQFTGRGVIPRGTESLEPFLQHGPYTTETAKALGRKWNVSPARIEHVTRGLFAQMGMWGLMLSDQVLRATGDYPETPTTPLTQKPIAKAFFSRDPNNWNRQVSQFYDTLTEMRTKIKTLNKLESDDDPVAEDFESEPETQKALDFISLGMGVQKELRAIKKEMNEIVKDKVMSGDDKKTLIDKLIREKTEITREFNNEIREEAKRNK